jgi:CHAT domain-containing protein
VRRLLSASADNVMSGTSATKDRLMKVSGPEILHIATHGYYTSSDRPEFTADTPVSMREGTL